MLSGDEVHELDAALGEHWHSALLQENAASIEPRLAAPAIADAAMRLGATVLQRCAVKDISLNAGRIDAVSTERGSIKTSSVVIAGGVWSPRIARHLGLDLPQLMIFAEMASVEPLENGPAMFGMTPAGYFRREPDGGYMFGTATGAVPITPTILKHLRQLLAMPTEVEQEMNPAFNLGTFLQELRITDLLPFRKSTAFQRNRIFQPEVIGKTSSATVEGMRRHIPAFRNSVVRERYAGALMTTLDNLGVISAVETVPGLYLGTGMLYGLTMSPAVGEAIAGLISGEPLKCDLSPYSYSRFVDGSELVFHP
jgi:glycine/D-amino acid oxidase-like deaminating enzyme